MSEASSPRLQVFIDDVTAPTHVLAELKHVTALGFADVRSLIESRAPVVDVEMFTNDWYEHGAVHILGLVSGWEIQGVGYILREIFNESGGSEGAGDALPISLDELRNIVSSGQEDRTRMEELDGLRCADSPLPGTKGVDEPRQLG